MGSAVSTANADDDDQCIGCYAGRLCTIDVPSGDRLRSTDPSTESTASASTDGLSSSGGSGWRWSGPPGEHSPYPIDAAPWASPQILYCFVDIMNTYKILKNDVNLGPSAVTTDVEKHLHLINDCYTEGFTLEKFARVPGVKMTIDLADWTTKQPYQAILTKLDNQTSDDNDDDTKIGWQLQVEKRILSTKTMSFSQSDNENDLLDTIHKYADNGSRLVCAEPVGYVKSASPNEQYGVMGVELFFNVPLHPTSSRYTYHTITVAAQYRIVADATQTVQQVECNADFLGQLRLFLNTGWKLVDICIDTSAIAEAYKMRATCKLVETIWIFEKEKAKLFDDTPIYEGVIIEYLHRVKVIPGKCERPSRDWRPVIAGMGITGWRLASIVQTPLLVQSTFTTYTMKLLFIFQRRLPHRHQQRPYHPPHYQPPSYQRVGTDISTSHNNHRAMSPPLYSSGTGSGDGGMPSKAVANGSAVPVRASTAVGVRVSNRHCGQTTADTRLLYDQLFDSHPASSTIGNGQLNVKMVNGVERRRKSIGNCSQSELSGNGPLPVHVSQLDYSVRRTDGYSSTAKDIGCRNPRPEHRHGKRNGASRAGRSSSGRRQLNGSTFDQTFPK